MLGRKELDRLSAQKQALLLESGLNRVAMQAELQSLRSATTWVREAASASRRFTPLLVLLAPVAGFLAARGARRVSSWFSRVVTVIKWVGPLYGLWKQFAPRRKRPEVPKPAA